MNPRAQLIPKFWILFTQNLSLSEFPSVVTEITFPLSGDPPTMSTGDLLNIQPDELQFPCKPFISKQSLSYFLFNMQFFNFIIFFNNYYFLFELVELRKQISCSLQLSNKTDNYVAFKVLFLFQI